MNRRDFVVVVGGAAWAWPFTARGQSSPPLNPVRQEWLDQHNEAILEPELPIVDPHHHLWIRPGWRYMADDLLADTSSGHNIIATVYVQARSMYRATGPVEMRPVGETEFVNGVAAVFASGVLGKTQACAGIVGQGDLTLGARVALIEVVAVYDVPPSPEAVVHHVWIGRISSAPLTMSLAPRVK